MKYFKISFYVSATDLETAYDELEKLIANGGMANTDQEITAEEFENQSTE